LNFFLFDLGFANSIKCNFEEVYKNGQVQQGLILIKDEKLRYQYFDKKLFTMIYKDSKLFLIKNENKKLMEGTNVNQNILDELMQIYKKFPNIQDTYQSNNYDFKIEKNLNEVFIKRLAIKSNQLNLSIYFNGCIDNPLNNIFFITEPLFDYTGK